MYVAAKHGKLYNISFPATGKKNPKRLYRIMNLKIKKKKKYFPMIVNYMFHRILPGR